MATEQVITAAVDLAVQTANIDADAPREARDERCRLDPDALAAVIRLCDGAKNRDGVLDVVDRALRRWIEGLDLDRTFGCGDASGAHRGRDCSASGHRGEHARRRRRGTGSPNVGRAAMSGLLRARDRRGRTG